MELLKTTSLEVRKRILTLFFAFMFIILGLAARFFYVQLVQGDFLAEKALNNRMRDIPVKAKRGILYDRNGHELAISISTDSIYAVPAEVKKSHREKEVAHKLSTVLDLDEKTVLQKVTKKSSFVYIKRQVDFAQSKKIKKMDLPGIGFLEESRRFYPKGKLACHVLGFSGIDNVGLDGLDLYYNKQVGGINGRIVIEYDGVGREIPEATHRYIAPREGYNLILTIDETIQYIVERELEKVVKERKPKAAYAIVMEPKTGEILAMASWPNFDPNEYGKYPPENRRNHVISDAFEPGSTMKIVTAAAALEEGTVRLATRFFCPGSIKVGIETINCAHGERHGSLSFADALAHSCNVTFVNTGLKLGADAYYNYLTAFGFGRKTGIDLPGEATGILVPKKRAEQQKIDLASMSMGQANAVTAIQIITAASAVANDGVLIRPHLVREIQDSNGRVIEKVKPNEGKVVISKETARDLRNALQQVVEEGSGKTTHIPGYRVAGKTGTAQKIKAGGGYLANEYIASFLGFAPADDPRLICMVAVDSPQGYPYFGGQVAGPVFREIMRDSLRYLEVPLSNIPPKTGEQAPVKLEERKVLVPDVVNLSPHEAMLVLRKAGLKVDVQGEGDVIWSQTPKAFSEVDPGTSIRVNLSPNTGAKSGAQVTVPDLAGKSMRDVARILSRLGLHLEAHGYGLVAKQNPEAGKKVQTDATIQVYFQPLQ